MTDKHRPFFWIQTGASAELLAEGINAAKQASSLSLLVLCSSESPLDVESFNAVLQKCSLPIFGGVFPEILFDGKKFSHAILVIGLPEALDGASVSKISNQESSHPHYLPQYSIEKMRSYRNFLLIVDGLSCANENFIDSIYEHLGSGNHYIGGGAGYLDLKQRECVISNEGLLFDAGIIVALPWELNLSTAHGWEILSGPYLATETNGCTIKSINYQPALKLYQKELSASVGCTFEKDDFFSISSHYPFGLTGIDSEIIVRDPISTNENSIVCVGEVLPNSMIHILKGDKDILISSVRSKIEKIDTTSNCVLIFDCISRVMFLDDRIVDELDTIKSELPEGAISFGAFSLGEIITGKSGAINWLNKSMSIADFVIEGNT